MAKTIRKSITAIMLLSTLAYGQNYSIHGIVRVLDRSTGVPLLNVRVDVDSSSFIAFTDVNGNYALSVASGTHNIRFSMPGYLGFFRQNVNVTTDTTFNASMPDTIQKSPDSTEVLTLDEYIAGSNYHGLNQFAPDFPYRNGPTWRNITEGNLIPVYLSTAISNDSVNFFQYIGSCDGDWTHAQSGSIENKLQRSLYLLSNNPQTGVTNQQTGVTTKGVQVNFNAQTTNTDNIVYEGLNFPYIYAARVNIASSNRSSIDKELFGRCFDKGDVSAAFRSSYMNANGPSPNDLDFMLNMVFFNYWGAIDRGEQSVDMLDMEYTPTFTMPNSSVITQPSNNSVNVPLDKIISWSNSFGSNTYELQLAKDSAFTNMVTDSSLGRVNAKLSLVHESDYFIRVRAKNDVGTSGWSAPVKFRTKHLPSSFSFGNVIPDTVKYRNINVVVPWEKSMEADNDTLYYLIHMKGGDRSDRSITTKDTAWIFPSSALTPGTIYTLSGGVTDTWDTTQASNVDTLVTSENMIEVVGNDLSVPKDFVLNQNYPDPFNPSTVIRYSLPYRSSVRITISNTIGQQVAIITNGEQQVGIHEVEWRASSASGVYFYRIEATAVGDPKKHFVETKKMLLLK